MKARLGTEFDTDMVLKLQKENLVSNMTDEEKENGFVTTPFTLKQLNDLIQNEGMFVLEDDGIVVGYAMAAGWDYFKGRPMFDYMIGRFAGLNYRGTSITYDNSFQYGPVCIALEKRGTQAFPVVTASFTSHPKTKILWVKRRVVVHAPKGFDVAVSPDFVRIKLDVPLYLMREENWRETIIPQIDLTPPLTPGIHEDTYKVLLPKDTVLLEAKPVKLTVTIKKHKVKEQE